MEKTQSIDGLARADMETKMKSLILVQYSALSLVEIELGLTRITGRLYANCSRSLETHPTSSVSLPWILSRRLEQRLALVLVSQW